jgi:GH43 family beta-xylosidase
MPGPRALALTLALVSACAAGGKLQTSTGAGGAITGGTGGAATGTTSASTSTGGHTTTASASTGTGGTGGSGPCTTHITYGDAWIHPPNHPDPFDDAMGPVTWDGTCTDEGANSFALLSNGWKPYFTGNAACVIALDTHFCPGAGPCSTRITYGAAWIPAPNHPDSFDDVGGRVYWDRTCTDQGGGSFGVLSNGWAPHFNGAGACSLSFRYTQCGGLYQNAVIPEGCADPGVLHDGSQYVVVCTSGNAANAFPIRTSPDMVRWTAAGSIFPAGKWPAWAASDFWAPEIHHVGTHYVAYFTARHQDGKLCVGAATAATALGPFTDIGQPLVHDATMGMIDPTELEDTANNPYLVWKEDGNAVNQPTPIFGQPLSPDGTALMGTRTQLITNDQPWEGPLVEGPWVVKNGGMYYLFYSGNAYYNGTYAVGVARSSNPLGPYQKAGPPILTSTGPWVGPGHCSVVDGPGGDTVMVYHAWQAGHVNGPGDVRMMLVDGVTWNGGWPSVPEAPSSGSRPMP